jgi:hypothetical protein
MKLTCLKGKCCILASRNSWYNDLKHYLTHGRIPTHLDARKRRALRLKYAQYQKIDGVLFQHNYDNVLHKYLEKDDVDHIVTELHDGPKSGHFGGDTTTHKLLRAGYYWLTLFRDAHAYAPKCHICQVNAGRQRRPTFPLQPVTVQNPFA